MTLPSIAEIRALSSADAIRAAIRFVETGGRFVAPQLGMQAPPEESVPFAQWLSGVLEEADVVVEAVGSAVKTMLEIESENLSSQVVIGDGEAAACPRAASFHEACP